MTKPGEVVPPEERPSWPRIVGIGTQHVMAMFGATFLVPIPTGFNPLTTLLFTGVGIILLSLITNGKLPSYFGSSLALITSIAAVTRYNLKPRIAIDSHKMALVQGGVIATGLTLAVIGLVVHFAGTYWIDKLMPPVVIGTIVLLTGFNLALSAWNNAKEVPVTVISAIVTILLFTVRFKGIVGRLPTPFDILFGYVVACVRGKVDFGSISGAGWPGPLEFRAPASDAALLDLFVPTVFALVAGNIGHVKSASAMTDRNLDGVTGRALFADGASAVPAGSGGGSGTTAYAGNISVMAATKVYSTAAYVVASLFALGLSFLPKFGVAVTAIPTGVLSGAATVLYGIVEVLGVRIWVQNRVDFSDLVNLSTAAVAMVVAIVNYIWVVGDMVFEGIALGSFAAIAILHNMRLLAFVCGMRQEPMAPASAPVGAELERGALRSA